MKILIENFKNFLTEGPMTRNLYHGSNESFDFKNFNIDAGVGAIYLFVEKEPAQKFAEYAAGNQCTYTIKLNSSANIVDMINVNTPEAQEVKDYIMEQTGLSEEQWSEFIECVDYCMFDFLDYNEEFVAFLQEKGIHGMHFWDGLDEINEPKIKVVALLSTDVIESAEKECKYD